MSDFKPPVYHDKKEIILKAGIPVAAALLLLLIFGIFLKKRSDKNAIDKGIINFSVLIMFSDSIYVG